MNFAHLLTARICRSEWRVQFWAALVLMLALLAVSLGGSDSEPRLGSSAIALADGIKTGDQALYAAIDQAVADGEGYYHAAARLHRERHYPLRPFVTVRLPTLAWLRAAVGPAVMWGLAFLLIVTNAIAWYRRFRNERSWIRFAALFIMAVAGAAGISPQVLTAHEWWAGLMLSLALALERKNSFPAVLTLAAGAALIRELAGAFLVILLAEAIMRRAWGRFVAVACAMECFLLAILLHRAAVHTVVIPSDIASQGWGGGRGLAGFADDLALLSGLDALPKSMARFFALLPLVGWLGTQRAVGYMPFCWFLAYAVGEGMLARGDNYYWAQIVLPAYYLGWLFVLSLLRKSWKSNVAPA